MKYFHELQEGLYDPHIFKAFFLAGGPGSGKSEVVRQTTGGLGMKLVNSDNEFERLLKQAGLSMKMPKSEEEPRNIQRDRAKEYPAIVDQLDDIYHNGIDGWKATIKVTKDKYPKP